MHRIPGFSRGLIWVNLLAHLVPAAVVLLSTASCAFRPPVPSDLPGPPTWFPRYVGQLGARTLVSGVLAPGHCRVIVVTTSDCGVAAELAVGWERDVQVVLDSAGSHAGLGWVVYAEEPSPARQDVRNVIVPAVVVQGGPLDVEADFGVRGTPYTFVVDSRDSVEWVAGGNLLPTSTVVQHACSVH